MTTPTTPRSRRRLAPKLVLLGATLAATGAGLGTVAAATSSAQLPARPAVAQAQARHELRSLDRIPRELPTRGDRLADASSVDPTRAATTSPSRDAASPDHRVTQDT